MPAERRGQVTAQRALLERTVAENEAFSEDALVIINFQKLDDARQNSANSNYAALLMSALAEEGHGPVHLGRAVTLEDDVDFDQIAIVSYAGINYFVEMVQSKFYTGIFGRKQVSDDLSSPTVPILQHL